MVLKTPKPLRDAGFSAATVAAPSCTCLGRTHTHMLIARRQTCMLVDRMGTDLAASTEHRTVASGARRGRRRGRAREEIVRGAPSVYLSSEGGKVPSRILS